VELFRKLKDAPKVLSWLGRQVVEWLTADPPNTKPAIGDFNALKFNIRPADVLLVSGVSRVSAIIQNITHSSWSHVAIYLGRINDIADHNTREHVRAMYDGDESDQLIIEPMPDKGTIISNLETYAASNVRLCRPSTITPADINLVISFAVEHLGTNYDIRQILDLGRYMSSSSIIPKKWKSSLFNTDSNQMLCSTLIARAFDRVKYPILPIIKEDESGNITLFNRNNKLCIPKDFDSSPYFQIIKFPKFPIVGENNYHTVAWDDDTITYDDDSDIQNNNNNNNKTNKTKRMIITNE